MNHDSNSFKFGYIHYILSIVNNTKTVESIVNLNLSFMFSYDTYNILELRNLILKLLFCFLLYCFFVTCIILYLTYPK